MHKYACPLNLSLSLSLSYSQDDFNTAIETMPPKKADQVTIHVQQMCLIDLFTFKHKYL